MEIQKKRGFRSAVFPNRAYSASFPVEMSEATDMQEKGREKPTLCEVCGEKPFKYTCPGCNKRTCSLACVKKHKLDVASCDLSLRVGPLLWCAKPDQVREHGRIQ